MKKNLLTILNIFFISAFVLILGCSGHSDPVSLETVNTDNESIPSSQITNLPDSIYVTDARECGSTYQAVLAAALVIIDPETLESEILPARNAQAIGDSFDADLTQFLTKSPCIDCLQIGMMNVTDNGNIVLEFKVKHPFPTLSARPDLHGFDVRGIIISNGTTEFTHTKVHLPDNTTVNAKGNINLLLNSEGYTSHFDSIAENPEYWGEPRNYDGNINPFKRFFVDPAGGTFNPFSPAGHNVMRVASGFSSAVFELITPTVGHIEFVFVVDVAYGQSAVFNTRSSPKYYLPWFNRKEPWKLEYQILNNELETGNTQSSAIVRAWVYDWQAGLLPDENYPDSGLNTIPLKSDIKKVTIEIPGVMSSIQVKTVPDGGNGASSNPYRFDFEIKNDIGALSGTYKGIIAARDDLDMIYGPAGVPEGPGGFPIEGPDIRDYVTYRVIDIEVGGGANRDPQIVTPATSSISPLPERGLALFNVLASDPDVDELSYKWQQVSPTSPEGIFENDEQAATYWAAPSVNSTTVFTFAVTIDDGRGGVIQDGFDLEVYNVNRPPVITGGPYAIPFNISEHESTDLGITASDPDHDVLTYQWLQISPVTPIGTFLTPTSAETQWIAPSVATDRIFKMRVLVSDNQYSASAEVSVAVAALNQPPIGSVSANLDPAVFLPSAVFNLEASFTDPDSNSVVLYEWDMDYDGVTFNVDYNTGTSPNLSTDLDNTGTYVIAVRGTDNGNPSMSSIATCDLAIKGKFGTNHDANSYAASSTKIDSSPGQKAIAVTDDKLYLLFKRNTGTNTEIRVASSDDMGVNFNPGILVKSVSNSITTQLPTIAAYDNNVWVSWLEDNDVRFARSTNSGQSFQSDIALTPITSLVTHVPSIAYDSARGNVLVAYADRNPSNQGIVTIYKSVNFGESFTHQAQTVTDNTATLNNVDIACTETGRIFISWIDTRNHVLGDVYYSVSNDGGNTFGANNRVNLDYSQNGVKDLSLTTGPDNEAYFAWIDLRSGFHRLYFAKTSSGGYGVFQNTNVSPSLSQPHVFPQIYVNEFGKIYIGFIYNTGSGTKTMLTTAEYAGGPFMDPQIQMNDTVTFGSVTYCDIQGTVHANGIADEILTVWTDFVNGESSGYGECFVQNLIWNAY